MRGENWEEIQENSKWRIETAGDFSVIFDPYLWKWLKYDDNGVDQTKKPDWGDLSMECAVPVFHVKQRDSSHSDQFPGTQRGQSSMPHFCMVGGVGSPASSHRLLSTFCVVLWRRTMQWAALICNTKRKSFHLCQPLNGKLTSSLFLYWYFKSNW